MILVKLKISNYNDRNGSTFCLFNVSDDDKWHLFDRISHNSFLIEDALDKLTALGFDYMTADFITAGSPSVKDAYAKRWTGYHTSYDWNETKTDIDEIVEAMRSNRLTINRKIENDLIDDINDKSLSEPSRLVRTVGLATHRMAHPIYPSSFAGDPI